MEVHTREDLYNLKTRDRRLRDALQAKNYVKAVYAAVREEARYGNQTYATFWLVDAYHAQRYLLNTIEYCYPWHRKSIRKSENPLKNFFMKRPIPEELYEPIVEELRILFPDCTIRVEQDPIQLLVIGW